MDVRIIEVGRHMDPVGASVMRRLRDPGATRAGEEHTTDGESTPNPMTSQPTFPTRSSSGKAHSPSISVPSRREWSISAKSTVPMEDKLMPRSNRGALGIQLPDTERGGATGNEMGADRMLRSMPSSASGNASPSYAVRSADTTVGVTGAAAASASGLGATSLSTLGAATGNTGRDGAPTSMSTSASVGGARPTTVAERGDAPIGSSALEESERQRGTATRAVPAPAPAPAPALMPLGTRATGERPTRGEPPLMLNVVTGLSPEEVTSVTAAWWSPAGGCIFNGRFGTKCTLARCL
mmetsp:Transcript_75118/g.151898  ORF Transcript_75118/g.151898 Transcript_75118/m.151898 type:complete len:296 (-) Transcript_75118:1304-2191(-)